MNTKTTYVLGGLAIIAALVLLIAQPWQKQPAKEAPADETTQNTVLKDAPKSDEVDRVEIQRPGEPKLAFVKGENDTGWRIVEPIDAPAVDYRVQNVLTTLTEMTQTRDYAAGDKNRPPDAEAGVGDEAIVATLHDAKSNKSYTFRIGEHAPLSSDTYVKVAGRDNLLVVKGGVREALSPALEDFRNKRMFTQVAREDVKSVSVAGAGQYKLTASDDGWIIEEPVRARADKVKVDSLVNAVKNLNVERFVEDAPKDLSRFALDEPAIKVTLTTEAKKQTGDEQTTQPAEPVRHEYSLLVGGRAGEAYFAKLGNRPWVFTITSRTRDELSKPLDELRDHQLLRFNKDNVTGITVSADGKSVTMTKAGDAWMLEDGETADLTAVDDLLKSARDLKAATFAEPGTLADPGLDHPRAAVSFTVSGEEAPLHLEVGNTTASGEMVYVRNPATGTTAIVRLADAENISRPPSAYRSRDMLSFGKGLANRIEVDRDGEQWVMERGEDEKTWRLTEPTDAEADVQAVDAILSDLYNLRARSVAGVGDAAEFGLDQPEATVSVRYQPLPQPVINEPPTTQPGGEESSTTQPGEEETTAASQPTSGPTWVEQPPVTHVVRIAEHNGAVYATVDAGNLVYEIDRQILHNLRAELLDRRIAPFEPSQVVGIRFIGSQGTTELNRVGDAWQFADDPVLPLANKKVAAAIKAISDLRTEHYEDLAPTDLAAYGLESPVMKTVITLDDHRTIEIDISNEGPDDIRGKYGYSSASGRVFVLAPDQLGAFNKSIEDFKIEQKK